jgi:hypothetical protein
VESHAPGCARCIRELEAMSPAVAVLGESVEQVEPPPELRERVLAIVHEEAGAREAPAAARRERPGVVGFLLRPAVALATLAVVAAGVTGYMLNDNGGGGGGQTTVPVTAQSGIGGTLVVGANSSLLDLHGMQQLTGMAVYQVWVAKGSSLRPSSDFTPDPAGKATTGVDEHLSAGTKVMVTREPRPGRTTPTPPILLSATVD